MNQVNLVWLHKKHTRLKSGAPASPGSPTFNVPNTTLWEICPIRGRGPPKAKSCPAKKGTENGKKKNLQPYQSVYTISRTYNENATSPVVAPGGG